MSLARKYWSQAYISVCMCWFKAYEQTGAVCVRALVVYFMPESHALGVRDRVLEVLKQMVFHLRRCQYRVDFWNQGDDGESVVLAFGIRVMMVKVFA